MVIRIGCVTEPGECLKLLLAIYQWVKWQVFVIFNSFVLKQQVDPSCGPFYGSEHLSLVHSETLILCSWVMCVSWFYALLFGPGEIPIRKMSDFNIFFCLLKLIFFLNLASFLESWQWKFTELYSYNVVFLKIQRNTVTISLMFKVCPLHTSFFILRTVIQTDSSRKTETNDSVCLVKEITWYAG
jgi:hypothetical protein